MKNQREPDRSPAPAEPSIVTLKLAAGLWIGSVERLAYTRDTVERVIVTTVRERAAQFTIEQAHEIGRHIPEPIAICRADNGELLIDETRRLSTAARDRSRVLIMTFGPDVVAPARSRIES